MGFSVVADGSKLVGWCLKGWGMGICCVVGLLLQLKRTGCLCGVQFLPALRGFVGGKEFAGV